MIYCIFNLYYELRKIDKFPSTKAWSSSSF